MDKLKMAVAFLLLIAQFGCSKKDEPDKYSDVLAVVGNDTISAQIFKRYLARDAKTGIEFQQLQTLQKKLTEYVNTRIIAAYGYENHLNDSPEIVFQVRTKQDEYFYQKYIKDHVLMNLISENETRDYYEKLKTEVRAKQILIKYVHEKEITVIDKSKRNLFRPDAKKLADSLYTELSKDPSKFSSFAEMFSDDVNSKFLDGDIGFIRIGETDPEFEKVVYSLKSGAISKPVETDKGFHILIASERRSAGNLKPYADARDGIRDMMVPIIANDRKQQILEKLAALNDSVLKASVFAVNKENIDLFLKRYRSIAKSEEIITSFDNDELTLALASYENGQIQILELALAMKENATKIKMNEHLIQKGLSSVAAKRIVADIARRSGYLLQEEEKNVLKNVEEKMMWDRSMKMLYENVSASEEDIKKYFESNKERYREPTLLDIQEISAKDLTKLNTLADVIRTGGDFDSVFTAASMMEGLKTSRTGLVPYNARDYMMANASTMQPGENSEPFQNIHGGFSMIKLVTKKTGSYLSFESVKEKVIMDCLNFRRQISYNEWIANLSAQYKVQIFPDRLKNVFDIKLK